MGLKDELLLYRRTRRLEEYVWTIENNRLLFLEVPMSCGRLKNWLHCFEDVNVIIFVVDMADCIVDVDENSESTGTRKAGFRMQCICSRKCYPECHLFLI